MNNEINVRTLCTGVETSQPITKERIHDICYTRLITRRVVLAVFMLETLKPSSRLLFNFIKNGHSLFVQAHERPKMQNNFFVYFFEQFFLKLFFKICNV